MSTVHRPESGAPLDTAEGRLLNALAHSARGPRRNGLFALWLFLRVCAGVLPPEPLTARAHRRRLESFERRLSSLSLPAPLRRAFPTSIRELRRGPGGTGIPVALRQLAAPSRESVGPEAAETISKAARAARAALRTFQTAGAER